MIKTIGDKLKLLAGSTLLSETSRLDIMSIKSRFDIGEILSRGDVNLIDDLYQDVMNKE